MSFKKIIQQFLGLMVVASLGSLMACADRNSASNPFLESWDNLEYNIPPFEKIETGHYMPAIKQGIAEQEKEIADIINNSEAPTFENTIVALDNSGATLRKVGAVLFNVEAAHSTPELQEIISEALPLLSANEDAISMNPQLFEKVKAVYDQKDQLKLTPVQMRLLEETYKGFVQNGATLSPEKQERLKEVNARISELQNTFGNNLLKATAQYSLLVEDASRLAGLPEDYLHAAESRAKDQGKEGWMFGLDNPSIMPFLQYVQDAALREEILNAYLNRCNIGSEFDNNAIVKELLKLRLEKASIMGEKNIASYILKDRMAKTPQAVYQLLETIWPYAITLAKDELKEMQEYRFQKEGDNSAFKASDWRYYANLVKTAKYSMDEEEIKAYFPLNQVRDGIFYLCQELYGIHFEELSDVSLPTPQTTAYLCKDADQSVLGVLFLDMHPRPGFKSGGAWNTNYVDMHMKDGKRVTPVTSIVCNFTPPTKDKPSLLTIDEVSTFFHEFGHALHGLFAQVEYIGLSEVPRDFVELPSQIMEHWATHPLMLKKYAKHYQTQEVIPDRLIQKIEESAKYGQGFATSEFLAAALLDMDYHVMEKIPEDLDLNRFEAETLNKRGLLSQIPSRYRTNYFAHTMTGGYTAGYYGYTWAEVLDADAFETFEESGDIFNKELATSFRKNILSNGGMYDAMKMYKAFRGREPKVDALLRGRGFIKK